MDGRPGRSVPVKNVHESSVIPLGHSRLGLAVSETGDPTAHHASDKQLRHPAFDDRRRVHLLASPGPPDPRLVKTLGIFDHRGKARPCKHHFWYVGRLVSLIIYSMC